VFAEGQSQGVMVTGTRENVEKHKRWNGRKRAATTQNWI